MLNSTEITSDKYREIMETISVQAETQFISTASRLRIEGKQEGRLDEKKETAMKMIVKGYSNKTIIELTDLEDNVIDEIRKEYIDKNE